MASTTSTELPTNLPRGASMLVIRATALIPSPLQVPTRLCARARAFSSVVENAALPDFTSSTRAETFSGMENRRQS